MKSIFKMVPGCLRVPRRPTRPTTRPAGPPSGHPESRPKCPRFTGVSLRAPRGVSQRRARRSNSARRGKRVNQGGTRSTSRTGLQGRSMPIEFRTSNVNPGRGPSGGRPPRCRTRAWHMSIFQAPPNSDLRIPGRDGSVSTRQTAPAPRRAAFLASRASRVDLRLSDAF